MEAFKKFLDEEQLREISCPKDCHIEFGGWICRQYMKADDKPIFMGDYKKEDFKNVKCREPVDEDLIETYNLWTAIFNNKRSEFNMMELGAGFGAWSMSGHHINKKLTNKPFYCVAIEPEPYHLEFLKRNIKDNNSEGIVVIDGIVDDQDEKEVELDYDPNLSYSWYGQNPNNRTKLSHKKLCKCYKLSSLLKKKTYWNTLHFDLQESELKVIDEAWDLICRRVKYMHIGTHSTDIENYLYKKFKDGGHWKIHQFYKCGHYLNLKKNLTEFGSVDFCDGVLFVENKLIDWGQGWDGKLGEPNI